MSGSVAPQQAQYFVAKPAPAWVFTVYDDSGQPLPLPIGTTFRGARISPSGVLSPLLGTFSIVNASQGLASYQFTLLEVNLPGTWRLDITAQLPGEALSAIPIPRGFVPATFVVVPSAEYLGGTWIMEANINVGENPASSTNPVPVIIISSAVLSALVTMQINSVNVSTSNPLPITAGQVGVVAPYGSNPASTNAGTDTVFSWGAQGNITVQRWILQNQTGADVHYMFDQAASVDTPLLIAGATLPLAQPVTHFHLWTAASQMINKSGGVILIGMN